MGFFALLSRLSPGAVQPSFVMLKTPINGDLNRLPQMATLAEAEYGAIGLRISTCPHNW